MKCLTLDFIVSVDEELTMVDVVVSTCLTVIHIKKHKTFNQHKHLIQPIIYFPVLRKILFKETKNVWSLLMSCEFSSEFIVLLSI